MRQVFFLFAFLSTIASSPVLSYVFFTFDPLGSVLTTVTGINNSGQIAGNFSDSAGFHAFIRTGTVYTTFEAPGALRTVAGGINSLSQITGNFTDATGSHGYIPSLDGKSFTTFDVLTPRAFTIHAAINNKGDVVGTGFSGSGAESFLRTAEGTFTSIRFPLANSTTASGITNTGEVVGTYINGGILENRHGFLRHLDGTYLNIDVPGVDSTEGAINSHDEIAGVVQDSRVRP